MKKNLSVYPVFFAAALLFLVLFSCKKDEALVKDYGLVSVPKDIADWTRFRPGSYWIYKDSISGILDSVYVSSIFEKTEEITKEMNKGYTGKFEMYTVTMSSSLDTFNYYNYYSSVYVLFGNYYPVFRLKGTATSLLGKTILLTRHTQAGKTLINDNQGKCISKGIHPQLVCGDSLYTQALEIFDEKNVTENNDSTRFFHVPKKGIVKKIIPAQNKKWMLIRYHIVQ